ncbi:MAG TPA: hypothetical protein VK085_11730 [Pseudogracilibacillus sp.]|nr:hypothetical protein [Pseudogracilibacillus sp.]
MLRNNKGFIWIETLVSLHVVILITAAIIPIYTSIEKERTVFDERSVISLHLYNELQIILQDKSFRKSTMFTKSIKQQEVSFVFVREGEYSKGCAEWLNAKKIKEKRCLYGINEE